MTVSNLPPQPTPFIGRETELADIARLLADPACRLLTIVGPGGIGKTRLALEGARHIGAPDGVFFVALQPLTGPDFIAHTIADALGIQVFHADDPKHQLLNSLRNKSILLLMDNFEHLLDGVGLLSETLSAAPGIKLLVTSRERLNLQEEWVITLDGLSFPENHANDGLENYSAAQLFVQRARQVQPKFSLGENTQAVKIICQQLEGMPLGIELAASWLRAMSCAQVAAHMQSNLYFLTTTVRNIPERHRSLNAVFEQSWFMLTTAGQDVLMCLSVFRGGFDLEAAEQVAGATLPLLAVLVDKSLIRLDSTGRYDLHEMLRQFAADKLLNAGQHEATIERFCTYFLKLAEDVEAHNFGHEQVVWYDRVEVEWDNFRAALACSEENETGLRMAAALGWFSCERGYWREGLHWLERMVETNPHAPVSIRAKALCAGGAISGALRDEHKLQTYCAQALALARSVNDLQSVGWALSHWATYGSESLEQKIAKLDHSLDLFRYLGDSMGVAHNLVRRFWFAHEEQDIAYARALLEEAAIHVNMVDDKIMIGWVTQALAEIAQNEDHDLPQARILYENSLSAFRQGQFENGVIRSAIQLATVEGKLGNMTRAHKLLEEVIIRLRNTDLEKCELFGLLDCLAELAIVKEQFEWAVKLMSAAQGVAQSPTQENISLNADLILLSTRLSKTAYDQAWAAGQAMTLQHLEAYVLSDGTTITSQLNTLEGGMSAIDSLTTRELDILRLMNDGLNSREIADKLVLGVSTVRWYLKQIYSKLDVHSRSEALARARELNLLT